MELKIPARLQFEVNKVNVANPGEKRGYHVADKCFLLWFGGPYSATYILAYGCLDTALQSACDLIRENGWSGLFCTDQVNEEYAEAIASGKTVEEAIEIAECDAMSVDCGDYLLGGEWGIVMEDPTNQELAAFYRRGN